MRHLRDGELGGRVLALDLLQGLHAHGSQRGEDLRTVGDRCLPDRRPPEQAQQRLVSLDFFIGLGAHAYAELAPRRAPALGAAYRALATFARLVRVLVELCAASAGATCSTPLRGTRWRWSIRAPSTAACCERPPQAAASSANAVTAGASGAWVGATRIRVAGTLARFTAHRNLPCASASTAPRSQYCDPVYREAAYRLGPDAGAARGCTVVYGGGGLGLMGAVADGALSWRQSHRRSLLHDRGGVAAPGLANLEVVEDMRERKHRLLTGSDAVVALPGGCGTLEELFEAITLKRLALYFNPIILLNTRASTRLRGLHAGR